MLQRDTGFLLVMAAGLLASCSDGRPAPGAQAEVACDAPGVTQLVERFGDQLKRVSLLAPDSIVTRELTETYATMVTPELLREWIADPSQAPGRTVSSPWPERIEVSSVEPDGAEACRAVAEVVYVTSTELTSGGAAAREPITLVLRDSSGWRISDYTVTQPTSDRSMATEPGAADSMPAPDEVLRRYYAAIDARDFRTAYELWGSSGEASGQTFDAFAAGFDSTAHVEADVGEPGRIDPAAGSRYVDVPVTVRAVTKTGDEQNFEGTYSLRRAVVDGASPAQRRWHIYSAHITARP